MKSASFRLIAPLAGVIFLLACGLPYLQKSQATPPSPTLESFPPPPDKTDVPASALTVTAPTEIEVLPPLKTSYNDIYFSALQSGQWTQGEGLLAMLHYLKGDAEPEKIVGDQEIGFAEMTGILRMARNFIKANPQAPESAEMEIILSSLAPDVELMMPYAVSEEEAIQSHPKVASLKPLPQNIDEICARLWENGFREPPGGERPTCVVYRSFSAAGKEFRVFYPRGWNNTERRRQALGWAFDAIRDSVNTYNPIAPSGFPNTDLVFTQLEAPRAGRNDHRDIMAALSAPGRRCHIGVFPNALTDAAENFKQYIAHEMFHCFQYYNTSHGDTCSYDSCKWWLEGTAEYFSNVVYPETNVEYQWIGDADANLPIGSIFSIDYANFLYFQYLGNTIGNSQIVTLLQLMPPSGSEDDYADAVTAFLGGNAGLSFHEFGKQYLDHRIIDSNGSPVPVHPQNMEQISMASRNELSARAKAYQLTWIQPYFPERFRFTLNLSTDGDGLSSARYAGQRGAWGALPGSFSTICGEREYVVLLTNVQAGTTYTLRINVTDRQPLEENEECDRCLIGVWRLQPETFPSYTSSAIAPTLELLEASGDLILTFSDDGFATYEWENLYIHARKPPRSGTTPTELTVKSDTIINNGDFSTNAGTIKFSNTGASGVFLAEVEGNIMTLGAEEFNWRMPAAVSYTCSEHNLTMVPQLGKPVNPQVFQKVQTE